MKRYFLTILSVIFIVSAILLVFSLPQCGHGGFKLGPVMGSTGGGHCGGNIYDRHITFLQTIFLAKLEWILFIILVLFVISTLFIFQPILFKIQTFYQKERLKKYFYNFSKLFEPLALVNCQGRVYQKLLE